MRKCSHSFRSISWESYKRSCIKTFGVFLFNLEPSPEGDLFDEDDVSSPFGKKGGMFSGGSGLFDEVEDNDEPKVHDTSKFDEILLKLFLVKVFLTKQFLLKRV